MTQREPTAAEAAQRRDFARSVRCPICGMPAGVSCKAAGGKNRPAHTARFDEAYRQQAAAKESGE